MNRDLLHAGLIRARIQISKECGDRILQRPRGDQPDPIIRSDAPKETALNTRRKMSSYLTDENEWGTPDLIGGRPPGAPRVPNP